MDGIAITLLEWALLAISLINTALHFYLALMIALNAERRSWGLWLSSGGLLVGGLFFVSHTAILGRGPSTFDDLSNAWWYLGLVAALLLPYVWYVAVLWYAGFWYAGPAYSRHRSGLSVSSLLTLILIGLFITANPFPGYAQVIRLELTPTPSIFGVPVLVITFALSTLLNIGLASDALRTLDLADDLARRRAQPWMQRTTIMLLIVTLLIALVMGWVVSGASGLIPEKVTGPTDLLVSTFDLLISGCIMVSVVCLGQAITRYEAFTGKAVPRRRLSRHWRAMLVLASVGSVLLSAAIKFNLHPIYMGLGVCVLLVIGYTILSQLSFQEREAYLASLRPVVASGALYDRVFAALPGPVVDLESQFITLCRDVLGAQIGYLVPLGPMASLVGTALRFPATSTPPLIADTLLSTATPQTLCIPLAAQDYMSAQWAVPLWSERGLIGVLLLGDKQNGDLYVQEEIEIGRAAAERMIDLKASAEITGRLLQLQRQHMMNGAATDHLIRRTLHDDILPQLHTTMLTLSASPDTIQITLEALTAVHRQIANLLHVMPISVGPALVRDGLLSTLKQSIMRDFADAFEGIIWEVEAVAEIVTLPPQAAEIVFHAIREAVRNAARHARGPTPTPMNNVVHLTITAHCTSGLELSVSDDGIGIGSAHQSGHGLMLHSTMIAIIGGTLTVHNETPHGTCVVVSVPAYLFSALT